MADFRHFFCAFLRATGVLVFFFVVVCGWGVAGAGGVLLWLVVSFFCVMCCVCGFSGNRVSCL